MHGGARGSGAPAGNRNALKQGLFTRFAIEERRQANALWREARSLLETLNDSPPQRRRSR
jgi:glucans biosynthesis protein